LPFEISFISPRTVGLRFTTRSQPLGDAPSLMLVSAPPRDNSWKVESSDAAITYTGAYGKLRLVKSPWRIEFLDPSGRLLNAQVAQSTAEMNWKEIELRAFSTDRGAASGLFALPGESLQTLRLESSPQGFALKDDPFRGRVKWQIK
jgi:hypothetical protein